MIRKAMLLYWVLIWLAVSGAIARARSVVVLSRLGSLLGVVFALAFGLHAQIPLSSQLTVQVTDQTGAVIPKATVSMTNSVGDLTGTALTNGDGSAALMLEPGTYEMSVLSTGFMQYRRQQIDFPKEATLNVTLLVANSTCSLCGFAGPRPPLETTQPVVARLIPVQTVEQVPSGSNRGSPFSITIAIAPGQLQTITRADFQALPHKTVTYHNAHTTADETYSGVPLTDLLAKYGAPTGDKLRGKGFSEYIVATGADGYKAVLSLAETDSSFHPGEVIVADSMDGKPLDAKEGPFKLVVTEDKRPARCVHNLVSIELRTAE